MSYWVNKGVLMEAVGGEGQGGSRVFVVCEEQAALAAGDQFTDRDDAEADMVPTYLPTYTTVAQLP